MCLSPLVYDRYHCKIINFWNRANVSDKFFHFDSLRKTGRLDSYLLVPCSKCIECRKSKAREWGFRCADELVQSGGVGSFVTLTYENAPDSLCKKDLQDFFKRFRRRIEPQKVRYFAAGEYGDLRGRSHFHVAFFGWKPDDLERFFFREDHWIYKSSFLSEVWGKGFITVEDLNIKNCIYIVDYLQKAKDYGDRVPPFNLMSRKPAIGTRRLSVGDDISDDKLYIDGSYIHLPRAYLRTYERFGFDLTDIKLKRVDNALVRETSQNELLARIDEHKRKSKP